ncbi:MAG: RNA polymerase subunit sigma [Sandaracinaceae bacterium]|nr:RNA polymerase subunit sigma [Sandaracinaceae bacterium]MDW8245907.1 Sir2 family NAD-dependent protein deacetylase [Sandaracinaceae bacterium]
MEDAELASLIKEALASNGPIVFLTGAGISAESGIPTFRGPEGYWRVGSVNYRPEALATRAAFERMPEEVWAWYLYRRGVCRKAKPNPAHLALVRAEDLLQERFLLITQNVDGLHLRAGNSPERTYQIHGNIDFARCEGMPPHIFPIPSEIDVDWPKERRLGPAEIALLRCCENRWSRPHVLWFDESYDEALFRFSSSLRAAQEAAMLVVIGTSGATTLPALIVDTAITRKIPFVCFNLEESPFTEAARKSPSGLFRLGPASHHVPLFVKILEEALLG